MNPIDKIIEFITIFTFLKEIFHGLKKQAIKIRWYWDSFKYHLKKRFKSKRCVYFKEYDTSRNEDPTNGCT